MYYWGIRRCCSSSSSFRVIAYIIKTPYEVPNLYLSDLIEVVVITYITIFLGMLKPLVKLVRCGYVP